MLIAWWNSFLITAFCAPPDSEIILLISFCFFGDRANLTLPSTLLFNLNWMPSVFNSFAISDIVACELITSTVKGLPVIYSFRLLIIFLNHSNNSLILFWNLVVGVPSNSFLKYLASPWVTISKSLSTWLKFLVFSLYSALICWTITGKLVVTSPKRLLNNSSFSTLTASINGCNISSIAVSSVTLPFIK